MKYIEERMDPEWGDRQQELVIIGQDLEKEKIINDLSDCLLTNAEIATMKLGALFNDPWPSFD